MRIVAVCVALSTLLLAGWGDVSEAEPAGVGVTDGPMGD
jgi:hypothetical protein